MTTNTAADVLRYFPVELRTILADLHDAPRSVAEATVQLLPFGSRAALESVDPPLAVPAGGPADSCPDEDRRRLELTPFAYEVMAAAAAAADADPTAVDDWTRRARHAAAAASDAARGR